MKFAVIVRAIMTVASARPAAQPKESAGSNDDVCACHERQMSRLISGHNRAYGSQPGRDLFGQGEPA
jgi:hypothetical protein